MTDQRYDAIVVGAGTSGGNLAEMLTTGGMKVLLLEAGPHYTAKTFPTNELSANAEMYWGGGVELNTAATLGILRPKVVGGGGIVNQALMDRFDDEALDSWRRESGVDFFATDRLAPWYEKAEGRMSLQHVDESYRNGNAEVFAEGFKKNGYEYAPLQRAQSDCRFEDGNCCIECLSGCRINSKQSTVVTAIPKALDAGLTLVDRFDVQRVTETADSVRVDGVNSAGAKQSFTASRVILAGGAIGNTRLLMMSGFADNYPSLGRNFYTHPQWMNFGVFDQPVNPHQGPLQNYKSADPGFRRGGFKLENVFGGPIGIALLVPGFGVEHMNKMRDITHFACIEVCIRDTNPGRIRLRRNGTPIIEKNLNAEDKRRRQRGMDAIRNVFASMGSKEFIEGHVGIGLHLMGGLNMGTDLGRSVVGPDFTLHRHKRIHAADSSIFVNAPGINPSLTIQALTVKAAEQLLKEA